MMNSNHHQPNCQHAASLVAYLYGEIAASEKEVFEGHLADCRSCSGELADFSGVRFAVAEWRDAEFAGLPTPAIEIRANVARPEHAAAPAQSYSARLRRLFAFSPATAALAALAAFVVFLGAISLVKRFTGSDERAGVDNHNAGLPVASPTLEKLGAGPSPISQAPPQSAVATKTERDEAPQKPEISRPVRGPVSGENPKSNSVRVSDVQTKPRIAAPPQKARGAAPQTIVVAPNKKRSAPRLDNFEEVDDDSPRLADLFDDIDTRK